MNVFPFLPCGWSYCALRSATQDLPSAPLSPSPLLNVLKAPMGGGGGMLAETKCHTFL